MLSINYNFVNYITKITKNYRVAPQPSNQGNKVHDVLEKD